MQKLSWSVAVAVGLLLAGLLWTRRATEARAEAPTRLPRVAGEGFPLAVELPGGGGFALAAPPARILPGNAGVVDFLSLLVPPERVAALPPDADTYSRVRSGGPGAAPGWDALPRFARYASEDLLVHRPDLLVSHTWQHAETHAVLEGEGIPVLPLPVPRSWEELLAELRLLGRVLGAEDRARAVEAELEARRARLASHPLHGSGLRALDYSNFGAGGFTAGAGTTVDLVFRLAGIRNAAAEAGMLEHAPLDFERLLELDPDVLVLPARAEGDATGTAGMLDDPRLRAELRALAQGRIVHVDAAVLTTTSPELLRAAEDLLEGLEALGAPR